MINVQFGLGGYREDEPYYNIVKASDAEGNPLTLEQAAEMMDNPEAFDPKTILANQAREAVSGFSESSGTRQAIEALADAIEQLQ